ncbi:uncharacterized protein LACBIDRAFT_327937 [Laccaria bicolor S238N-H82]|uniref:Predicted protein n=1 Tax=Laccaria bicolor (strain S238N-H82 / ATCC MYA-4686) TaxID=486041 RepID=B0DD98_LACBS|nr:uncharacterized protein LACBIDRAFT_327937 [Laccaria bicolor S238N-H82]EDR07572.1 predicted protein [Laccaria bicolor S238N-H82]|eukprot:XP_001881964.1 predicted protein [Laccaria bicolor S238N-H82]
MQSGYEKRNKEVTCPVEKDERDRWLNENTSVRPAGPSECENTPPHVFGNVLLSVPRGLKPSVVISEFESHPDHACPRQHLSRKSHFLQGVSRQITVSRGTSHKTEASNHSLDRTFWRHQGLTSPPSRKTYKKWIYSEAPPEFTKWNAHPFNFGIRFCERQVLTRILHPWALLDRNRFRNHLPSIGNMAPNRSKSACGSVGNKVYCEKLRLAAPNRAKSAFRFAEKSRLLPEIEAHKLTGLQGQPPEFAKHSAYLFEVGVWFCKAVRSLTLEIEAHRNNLPSFQNIVSNRSKSVLGSAEK